MAIAEPLQGKNATLSYSGALQSPLTPVFTFSCLISKG
jgi:hypothetical protein